MMDNALLSLMQPAQQGGNALNDPLTLGLLSGGAAMLDRGNLSQGVKGFVGGMQSAQKANEARQKEAMTMAMAKASENQKARQKISEMLYKDIYKQSETVVDARNAYDNLLTSLSSERGVGDVASIIGFMKTLDPRSIVTEGEADAVISSQGMFAKFAGELSKALTGEGALDDKTKGEIARIARQALANRFQSAQSMVQPRLEMADRALIPREEVAPTFMLSDDYMGGVNMFSAPKSAKPQGRGNVPAIPKRVDPRALPSTDDLLRRGGY